MTSMTPMTQRQPPKSKTQFSSKRFTTDPRNMEGAKGVLSHLNLLKVQARSLKTHPEQQQSRVKELKAKVEALKMQRDQLKAEIQTHQKLQKLRSSMKCAPEEEEEMSEDCEDSQLLWLMARHSQLKDLLHAHHFIGGYDIMKTRKGVCVSLATAYEGVYLDTYNLEIDMKPRARLSRHNIPSFVPLDKLAEQTNLQTDLRPFLDNVSQHLNAFAGRKQQLKLVKEQHQSVEVMESNVLCSILVLMLSVLGDKTAVLCTLNYTDHARCLPTQVHLECEDEQLPNSPLWKKNCSLLMETPVHKALLTMKKMGHIV